jgi:TrbL/VirB6 plasmid conjugal transfer protein
MTRRSLSIVVMLAVGLALLPAAAHAAGPGFDITTCAPGPTWQYTQKIVTCVETKTEAAVTAMMSALASYMTPVVGAMLTLAVGVFGMRMMGGEPELRGKAIGFCIRAALVVFFFSNLGGYANSIFAIETQLTNLVSGVQPWTTIDSFIGTLFGVGPPPLDISKGLLGILGASILSSTGGGMMAFIALAAIINLLLFIFRVVFTYLMAIVMIGFLIAISPLIIPMALFVQHTERFFSKWLDILISAMLVPILMFAFLSVFLGGFSNMASDIITILQCGSAPAPSSCNTSTINFGPFMKMNLTPGGSWLFPTDPTHATEVKTKTGNPDVGTPAVQTNMYPAARRAYQANRFTKPSVDLGPNDVKAGQQLIATFLGLWIFSSFMKSLIERIPDLASNITEASSYISMGASPVEQTIGQGLKGIQTAITGRS